VPSRPARDQQPAAVSGCEPLRRRYFPAGLRRLAPNVPMAEAEHPVDEGQDDRANAHSPDGGRPTRSAPPRPYRPPPRWARWRLRSQWGWRVQPTRRCVTTSFAESLAKATALTSPFGVASVTALRHQENAPWPARKSFERFVCHPLTCPTDALAPPRTGLIRARGIGRHAGQAGPQINQL